MGLGEPLLSPYGFIVPDSAIGAILFSLLHVGWEFRQLYSQLI